MFCKLVQNLHFRPSNLINSKSISCTSITHNKRTTKTPQSKPTSKSSEQENWTQIYRLPLVRIAAAFNKIKLYQYGLTISGIPITFWAESIGQVEPKSSLVFAAVGITGSITLTLCSLLSKNLIGIIYVKQNSDQVRLSYIDFWGKRKNIETTIDDIIPPEDIPRHRWDLFQPVKIINKSTYSAQNFKLLQRFGVVSDKERFTYIFGE